MKKFLRITGIVALSIIILIGFGVLFAWSMDWFAPRRQPLEFVAPPPAHETPFDVTDRQDDTRDWIQERLDGHEMPPRLELIPRGEPP